MVKEYVEGDRLRHRAAMLRLAAALKRNPGVSFEAAAARVAEETGIELGAFGRFLDGHAEFMSRVLPRHLFAGGGK